MIRPIALAFALMWLPIIAAAQEDMQSLRVVDAGREDLGTLKGVFEIGRAVVFENVLDVPVSVEVVRAGSGCTEATLDRETLNPGQQTTLTIVFNPLPVGLPQRHCAQIRATWNDGASDRAEDRVFCVAYTPGARYVVQPERALVAPLPDETAFVDIFVRAPEDSTRPFTLPEPSCSLAGWEIRPVPEPDLPAGILRFRAQGPAPAPGYADAMIAWKERPDDIAGVVEIPMRLRVAYPMRVMPGGATFVIGDASVENAILRLIPRTDLAPTPHAVLVECPWVRATLADPFTVRIGLEPDAIMPPIGSTHGRVVDEAGRALADFPIVWWTPDGP